MNTGAEVLKTPAQRKVFGGIANAAFDTCYHQACDTIDNVDHHALTVTSQAVAGALQFFFEKENLVQYLREGKGPTSSDLRPPPPPEEVTEAGGDGGARALREAAREPQLEQLVLRPSDLQRF